MIWKGKRIAKDRDYDLDKGDIGYKTDKELTILITKYRILLSDIVSWDEYKESPDAIFFGTENIEPKVRLYNKDSPNVIILLSIEEFDIIMDNYYKEIKTFKHN